MKTQKHKNIKSTLLRNALVCASLLAAWATPSSQATVVNLDLGPTAQVVYTYEGALVTGDAHYWNNGGVAAGIGATQTATFNNLTASDGTTATPWDVSLNYYGTAGSSGNALLADLVYSINVGSGHLTISDLLPNQSYAVYMYHSDYGDGNISLFTMGAASDFTGGITLTLSSRTSDTVPTDITGTTPVYSPLTDYAVFNVTSDSSGNLYGHYEQAPGGSGSGNFAGLQITEFVVPEPSIALLLGLGGVLVLRRRRKKS